MVKWMREWTADPEVGVQVQISKKEILFWKLALIVLELLATVSGLDEALEWGADS